MENFIQPAFFEEVFFVAVLREEVMRKISSIGATDSTMKKD